MKTIKSVLKISITMIVMLSFFTSCEDFLEEQPSTTIDGNNLSASVDGLNASVIALYKKFRQKYERDPITNSKIEDFLPAQLLQCRNDLNLSRSGYLGLVGRYQTVVSPDGYGTNLVSKYVWKHNYQIAAKATEIIAAGESLDGGGDEVAKNNAIAQAKFFRAHAYFTLYRMFNNIYVSTETITVDNAYNVIDNRSTDEEILNLLYSDLDFAIEHLEWTSQFGRVTKGAAKHVKAKVAMWKGDWAEAKMQAESTISDGPHSLVGTTAEVFNGTMDHSEQLFVVQNKADVTGGGMLTMINANYVVKHWKADASDGSTTDFTQEYGGAGFARLLPNHYLLDLLAADPNDTRDDDTYFRLKYYFDDGPRAGEVNDTYTPVTYDSATDTYIPSTTYIKFLERLSPSCVKFADEDNDPTTYWQINNFMIYRLGETYLIAAEANFRLNGGGQSYLDAVRTRANAGSLPISLNVILDERARELAFEGQRWYTLKRFGIATMRHQMQTYSGDGQFVPAYYNSVKDPRVNWQDHYINFPIAQIDLDLLGANYPQNAGY